MLISLGLNVLVFPQPLDDRPQLLLMRMSEGVLRFLRLGFSHVTEGIVESMELVVEIIQRVVDPLAALALAAESSIMFVRLIIISTLVAPFPGPRTRPRGDRTNSCTR